MTRPLPDWAKQATPIVNPDPSAASTRQTPPPVPGPSDGGNASERDSQLAGTASAGATLQAMRKILRDAGLIDPESNADERPNAGQDGTVPLDDHLTVVDLGIALIEALAAEKARADAAEAKLREVSAERGIIASGYRERVAERDAALSKLDAITDHAGSFHAAMLGPAACNPDSVRVRAVAALDGIRDVITDQGDFTAVTRERLADRAKLDEIREALDNRLAYPSPAYAFAEIRAIAERPAAAPAESSPPKEVELCQEHDGEWATTCRDCAAAPAEPREDCPSCAGLGDVPCAHRPGQVVEHQPPGFGIDGRCCRAGATAYPRICPHHGHGRAGTVEHQPAADASETVVRAIGLHHLAVSEAERVRKQRDLALWLHAEAAWKLNRATYLVGLRHIQGIELQARIDKALALCEPHPLRHLDTQLSIAGVLRGEES